jgi:hypothetical protein
MTEHSTKTQHLVPPEHDKNLYEVIKNVRETVHKPLSRIMIVGYFNESVTQR